MHSHSFSITQPSSTTFKSSQDQITNLSKFNSCTYILLALNLLQDLFIFTLFKIQNDALPQKYFISHILLTVSVPLTLIFWARLTIKQFDDIHFNSHRHKSIAHSLSNISYYLNMLAILSYFYIIFCPYTKAAYLSSSYYSSDSQDQISVFGV